MKTSSLRSTLLHWHWARS